MACLCGCKAEEKVVSSILTSVITLVGSTVTASKLVLSALHKTEAEQALWCTTWYLVWNSIVTMQCVYGTYHVYFATLHLIQSILACT